MCSDNDKENDEVGVGGVGGRGWGVGRQSDQGHRDSHTVSTVTGLSV